jgi:release factor glutamine methyltransferase
MLADVLDREPRAVGGRVLDLCTGSGFLAIKAALRGASAVVAVDVSRRALVSVRLNARLNGVKVRAVRGDLFEAVRGQRFDVIVSNPPYLPGPVHELPRRGGARAWEAGPRGRAFIDRICDRAFEHLAPGGVALIVHSSLCSEQETLERFAARGMAASLAASHHGPLGPILQSRAKWLRDQGLLAEDDSEDIVIVRAQRPMSSAERPGDRLETMPL